MSANFSSRNRLQSLAVLFCLVLLVQTSCDNSKPVENIGVVDNSDDAADSSDVWPDSSEVVTYSLYVSPDGSGNGSAHDPMGSIQDALDSAAQDPKITSIGVAVGQFDGSLIFRTPITIAGSLDPELDWSLRANDSTVIHGTLLDNKPIALAVIETGGLVSLSHLRLSSQDAVDPGASSIGVFVLNSELRTTSCRIAAGAGAPGENGEDRPGEPGYTGWCSDSPLCPIPGGRGGDGARCDGTPVNKTGQPGSPSPEGLPGGGEEEDGLDGSPGLTGNGGRHAITIQVLHEWPIMVGEPGDSGTTGTFGSGGGGGHGGVAEWHWDRITGESWCYINGPSGGHGGASGWPGRGGGGGKAGGSSVAILSIGSRATINSTLLVGQNGGRGGIGGFSPGGTGGRGGSGNSPYGETAGGDGGDGGPGGQGGGGAGGWSIGLMLWDSPYQATGGTGFIVGQTGLGGYPGGSRGVSRQIYVYSPAE